MVFGGDALLGTCVGFKGLYFVRRAEKSLERSRGFSGTLFLVLSLRRPALAVGHGVVARGPCARLF